MELWDAYDDKLNKIDGVTLVRGEEVPVATKAYHAKRASKLLLSGGIVNGCDKGHAEDMRKKAIELKA